MRGGTTAERRGFLRALALGTVPAAAGAQRVAARHQADGRDVQACYRTKRYEQ